MEHLLNLPPVDAELARLLRRKERPTDKEASDLRSAIQSGNLWPSYGQMLNAWIAGAWTLLEALSRLHVETDPQSARPYIFLAVALGRQGKAEEANQAHKDVYVKCGDLAEVEYETCVMLAMDGYLPEARYHYSNYLYLIERDNLLEETAPDLDETFQRFLQSNGLPIQTKFHQTPESN